MISERYEFIKYEMLWKDNDEELTALFDQLCDACEPADEGEIGRLRLALSHLRTARRERRHLIEMIEEIVIIESKNFWWDLQQGKVQRSTALLVTEPARAVVELKRCALGCLWLIDCWLGLESLLERESASPGADRGQALRVVGR